MNTKSLFAFALAAVCCAALQSCDPQAFSMNVEMRYPSNSGLVLDGKSVAVVYLEEDAKKDSVFNEYLANGFASAIEKDYFGGNEEVSLYRIEKDPEGQYASPDSLINLIMETGSDVVFLFDTPEYGEVSVSEKQKSTVGTGQDYYVAAVPVRINLYAFDSLSGKDSVMVWSGSRKLTKNITADFSPDRAMVNEVLWGELASPAEQLGYSSAKTFSPSWKEETYTFIYFDTPSSWITAAEYALDYKWQEAMKIWMTLADTKNSMRRSCAEYNVAIACYLMGDNELALKWLNLSDKDNPISLSKTLRNRIESRRSIK